MSLPRSFAILGLLAATLAAQAPPAQPAATPRQPGLYATFKTSMGDFTARLFEKETPITVKNFVDLELGRKKWQDPKTQQWTTRPLYNNTIFHRVIAGFMIQGGDPAGNGAGNVGFTIKDEFVPTLRFDRPGLLGMANIGEPNTGAAQFFVTVAPYAYGNNKHTIWGEVVEGYDVVQKISQVKTRNPGVEDRPLTPVRLLAVAFSRAGEAPPNDVLKGGAPPAKKKAAPAPKKK